MSVIKSSSNGQSVKASTSTDALTPILSNSNTTGCSGFCFRSFGLAFDRSGRLFMMSDSTGEIYVIIKSGGNALNESRPPVSGAALSVDFSVAGLFVGIVTSAFACFL